MISDNVVHIVYTEQSFLGSSLVSSLRELPCEAFGRESEDFVRPAVLLIPRIRLLLCNSNRFSLWKF